MSQMQDLKVIKVNGVDIAYRFDGPQDGPVLLVANSLMANGSMWDGNVPALADRYRVLRYDKRGHGGSGFSKGPYTIAQLADDAIGLLDALGIQKAHFMGLSIGGMIGQQLGARFPDRILSLTLCNTASEMPPRSLWEDRFQIADRKSVV